jgi:hypothetical protein
VKYEALSKIYDANKTYDEPINEPINEPIRSFEIIKKKEIPDAWTGLNGISDYCSINDNNIYDENTTIDELCGVNYGSSSFTNTPIIQEIDSYSNKINIQEKLLQREAETFEFSKSTAGYGIFDNLNVTFEDMANAKSNDENVMLSYTKLMNSRNQQL